MGVVSNLKSSGSVCFYNNVERVWAPETIGLDSGKCQFYYHTHNLWLTLCCSCHAWAISYYTQQDFHDENPAKLAYFIPWLKSPFYFLVCCSWAISNNDTAEFPRTMRYIYNPAKLANFRSMVELTFLFSFQNWSVWSYHWHEGHLKCLAALSLWLISLANVDRLYFVIQLSS